MRKEDWLEAMVFGGAGEKIDPVPLESPDGVQIDPDRFWLEFRFPTGDEFDVLTAIQTRNIVETETFIDPDDIENSYREEVEYTDTRRAPILYKAVDLGLIVDANLPEKKKDGSVGVYKWSRNRSDNIEFLRKRNPILLMSLIAMLHKYVLNKGYAEVVEEGEESVGPQDVSTSGPQEPEEV